jgi:hypothetical protein
MARAYLSELFAPGLPLRGSPDSRANSLGAVPAAPSSLPLGKPQPLAASRSHSMSSMRLSSGHSRGLSTYRQERVFWSFP